MDGSGAEEVFEKKVSTGFCLTDMNARDFIMGSPNFPVILGHEESDVIEKVGRDDYHLKAGNHIVLNDGFFGEMRNLQKQ